MILSNQYLSPERDSNLGLSRIPVFEDGKATALTTHPPQLDINTLKPTLKFSVGWETGKDTMPSVNVPISTLIH